jgi:predicted transcriptional regulator
MECKRITKVILPAIRASVAEIMCRKYDYNQEEVAAKLGVVQVAVSKYLNNRYSKAIDCVRSQIISMGLNEGVIERILGGGTREEIDREIDALCDRLANFNPT